MKKRKILDACCGSRMFWFDKNHPNVVYADIRQEEETLCDGRKLEVHPDVISDFTNMIFEDSSFKLVVFDPPHLSSGKNSWLYKKYGVLPKNRKEVFTKAFAECFRVLKDDGILVFKWNEEQVSVKDILELTEYKPLFGHTTGRSGKTKWIVFMKIKED